MKWERLYYVPIQKINFMLYYCKIPYIKVLKALSLIMIEKTHLRKWLSCIASIYPISTKNKI